MNGRCVSKQQTAVSSKQKRQRRRFWLPLTAYRLMLSAFLALSAAGCSTLTHTYPQRLMDAGQPGKPPLDDGYTDYAGVIHIHTTYSHDAQGRFEDVVRVANAQHLDYVIVTEHNNLKPLQEGLQGWHGTTLVLIGTEISTRDGHYLALHVTKEIDREQLTTQQIIDAVNQQGGFGFIAHPYFKHSRWRDWSVHGFTGIEIYNMAHDALDENRLRLVLWTLTTPAEPFYFSILDRPYDPLRTWDGLIQQRGQMVGIGSADAHEFHVMGIKFAPYEDLFQLVRTHILVPTDTPLTPDRVYEALRQGHAYVGVNLIGNPKGFAFMADDGQRVLGVMGDLVTFMPHLQLTAVLPAPAQLTLFKDGQAIGTFTGAQWRVPVAAPGVYRLEAMRHTKPWIFSNPIYVRPAPIVADRPSS